MAISRHNLVPDLPDNNFATLNSSLVRGGSLSNGNLTISGGGNHTGSFATIPIQRTGKWYVEVRTNDTTVDHAVFLHSIDDFNFAVQGSSNAVFIPSYSTEIAIYTGSPYAKLTGITETATTSGDVLGYLFDVENGEIIITRICHYIFSL